MAGHASGWHKVAGGPLKGQSVFISKAAKEQLGFGYKSLLAFLKNPSSSFHEEVLSVVMATQPGGAAITNAKAATNAKKVKAGTANAELTGLPYNVGYDEAADAYTFTNDQGTTPIPAGIDPMAFAQALKASAAEQQAKAAPAGPKPLPTPTPGVIEYKNKYGHIKEAEGQIQGGLGTAKSAYSTAIYHLASGQAIAFVKDESAATAMMQELNQSGIDWEGFSDFKGLPGDQQDSIFQTVTTALKNSGGYTGKNIPDYALTGGYVPGSAPSTPSPVAAVATPSVPDLPSVEPPATTWASSPAAQALIAAQASSYELYHGSTAEKAFIDAFKAAKPKGAKALTAEEKSAIKDYQGYGYASLNPLLWSAARQANGKMDVSDPGALGIMSAMKKLAAPFDFTSTRAVRTGHELHAWATSAGVGDLYVNKGFDSASLNPNVSPIAGSGPLGTRVRFRVPQGSKGLYMNGLPAYKSSHPEELEWLVPANSSWVVSGKTVGADGVIELMVDLIGQQDFDGKQTWP